jgi:hypothetical protein
VVLRNGYVLRGRVTALGDQYVVALSDDDQVHLPSDRVAIVCRDLDEAYLRQRDLFPPTDVRAHLKLAAWCFGQQLTARAADQLLAVFALDPAHPELAAMENRLRSRDSQPPATATLAVESSVEGAADESLGHLSAAALEQFTVAVQPLLLNRCAANACHGKMHAATGLQLHRPAKGRLLTARMTQRNLAAALQQVNRDRPLDSPLITVPSSPHAGTATVWGPSDEQQLVMLREWVLLLTTTEVPQQVAQRQTNLWQTQARNKLSTDGPPTPSAAATPPQTTRPLDPFDPEIFHARHDVD